MIGTYYEMPRIEQMAMLAKVNSKGVIQLQQNPLKILNNYTQGQINIICFDGFQQNGYTGTLQLSRSSIKYGSADNCMLIRLNPIIDPRTRRHLFFSEIVTNNPVARQKLHVFAALVSNVVLVVVDGSANLSYLSTISKHVSSQGLQRKNSKGINITKTASLICINAQHSQNNEFITDSTNQLASKLQSQNILPLVTNSYSSIKGLNSSQQSLINPSPSFIDKLMQEIDMAGMSPKDNSSLMYGPILVKYMGNLALQFNSQSGSINTQKAQDQIVIDEGYIAYAAGVSQFHRTSLNLIQQNSRPDDNQLQEILDLGRERALEQFYLRGGSANNQYRRMLDDYINNKSRQVIDHYSLEQWNRNLEILQSESRTVLDKVSASRVKDNQVLMGYINQMSNNYYQNARGPLKYDVYNDYMKIFAPLVFEGDPQKQERLRLQYQKNQDLQARVRQLKKQKQGGCCSKCSIM